MASKANDISAAIDEMAEGLAGGPEQIKHLVRLWQLGCAREQRALSEPEKQQLAAARSALPAVAVEAVEMLRRQRYSLRLS